MKIPIYALRLVREKWSEYPAGSMRHPQVAALFFRRLIGQADREHSAVLFLDADHVPLGASIIGIGSLTRTELPVREVFKAALLANSHSVILSHNHPNIGVPVASPADIRTTRRIVRGGQLLGIRVLDHIIVCPDGFMSMREAGLMWSLAESTVLNSQKNTPS